ncbi:MAG: S-layer homology domain-containing protein [Lachnospiraceae bacterium]|nr:S-layer homology domain-containing protein [Lachnospiraceae bacterium]
MLKRKIMGLLLAAAMLATMLPASALTAQAEEALPEETVAAAEGLPAEAAAEEEALPEETAALPEEEAALPDDAEEPYLSEQDTTISSVTVRGVRAPASGQTASVSGIYVASSDHCTLTNVYWYDILDRERMETTDVFYGGRSYRLYVALEPNDGYAFADRDAMTITVRDTGGNNITSSLYGTLIYDAGGGTNPNRSAYIQFPVIGGSAVDYVCLYGEPAPAVGQHPRFSGYSYAPRVTGSSDTIMRWRCLETDQILTKSDTFEYGMTYRMEIAYLPEDGYRFPAVQEISVGWNGSLSGFTENHWIDGNYTNRYGYSGLRVDYTFPRVGGPFTTIYSTYIKHLPMPYPGDPVSEHLYLTELSTEDYSVRLTGWRDYTPGQGGRAMSSSEAFRPGGLYQLELVMTPDEGYWFTDVGNLALTIENIDSRRFNYSDRAYNDVYPSGPLRPDRRVVFVTFRMPGAFTDVANESDFWYRPVYWGASEEITTGWADNTFRPWNTCNRASIITFLWRLAGSPMQHANDRPVFGDVDGSIDNGSTEFYPAIMWGYGEGIISGYSDGTFRPWNTCNRMQIATFLYRFAKLRNGGADVLPETTYQANVGSFSDLPSGEEFRRAIVWAAWMGITTGYSDGTFRPMNPCNRAQAMTFLYRYDRYSDMVG